MEQGLWSQTGRGSKICLRSFPACDLYSFCYFFCSWFPHSWDKDTDSIVAGLSEDSIRKLDADVSFSPLGLVGT